MFLYSLSEKHFLNRLICLETAFFLLFGVVVQQWDRACPAGAFRLIDTDNNIHNSVRLSLMKMDLAGLGGAQAHGVAACQSQPSDIWERISPKGGRELHRRVHFHIIITLYHNPLLVAHEINVRAGSYHSCCLDLMVTVNYSFHFIDL